MIDLREWTPKATYGLVVLTPQAMAGLSQAECDTVISALQKATVAGGLHVVEFQASGKSSEAVEKLRARYAGWEISNAGTPGAPGSFVAKKGAA